MNVSLTPELEAMVAEKVQTGLYNSASEVVREGLRLLREQDEIKRLRLEDLKREIQKGIDQLENGQFTSYESGAELVEEIMRAGRERVESHKVEA